MVISVETMEMYGSKWVSIREWDGFDRPSHTCAFKISDVEMEFVGGRFERMVPTDRTFPHKICTPITDDDNNPEHFVDWIHENTTGQWNFEISDEWKDTVIDNRYYDFAWAFTFKEDVDATAFKLRWA